MPDNPTQPPPGAPATPPGRLPNEPQIRQWNMWCHLSALAGLVVPFGNILGPLLVWQIKKQEFPSVESHGKAALNFQLTVIIAFIGSVAIAFGLSLFCIGYLLFPAVFLIPLAGLVFTIIAGLKANEGNDYKYPYSLNLIS